MKVTFDHFKTILCVLVIPIMIWGVKLEVNNAVMTETIERMESDIEKTNETRIIVEQNRIALAQLKERIDSANETLKDIKDILRSRDNHDRD
tara:strand:- start:903 stop:1178 length:276 start_codon:yes stop_codon:yes gene_type:complete